MSCCTLRSNEIRQLIVFIFVASIHCHVLTVEGKGVYVKVVAPWTETPLLQEGCEAVASLTVPVGTQTHDDAPSGFYKCLEDVWLRAEATNRSGGARTMTQKEQYDVLMDIMQSNKHPPHHVAFLTTKLAVRMHSPTVEAHRQLAGRAINRTGGCAAEGRPFALIGNKAFCDEHKLAKELELKGPNGSDATGGKADGETELNADNAMSVIANLDHVHPHLNGPNLVIMYGIVGEGQTMRLLQAVKRHKQTTKLVFRHLPVSGNQWNDMLAVQGYGVSVDIKSTEYRAVDDRIAGESTANLQHKPGRRDVLGAMGSGEEHLLGGFNISLLQRRYPDQSLQLSHFEDAVGKNIEQGVKVDLHSWEKAHIGIAAAQYVMDPSRKPLHALLDVLTNFPNYASLLSRMSFVAAARKDPKFVRELDAIGRSMYHGASHVFLNGCAVTTENINLFYMMEKIEEYERLLDTLSTILVSRSELHSSDDATRNGNTDMTDVVNGLARIQFQGESLSGGSGDTTARVWLPQDAVTWFNDVENNAYLYRLPTTLRSMLRNGAAAPTLPRRNVLHVVCIADPTTYEGMGTIFEVARRAQQPIRFGVVFVDKNWSPEVTLVGKKFDKVAVSDASKATLLVAATVWELMQGEADPAAVSDFLMAMTREMMAKQTITELSVKMITQSVLMQARKRAVDDVVLDPAFITHYEKTQKMVRTLGFSKFPVVLLNGRVHTDISIVLQHGIWEEFAHLQKLVEMGALSDDDDNLYESVLELSGARTRYVAALFENKTFADWSHNSVLSFLHKYPFIYPSTSGMNEVSLVSGVLTLHVPVTAQSLQATLNAVRSLLLCKGADETCGRTRLTFAVCGTSLKTNSRTVVDDLHLLLQHCGVADKSECLNLLQEFLLSTFEHSHPGWQLDDPKKYEHVLKGVKFSDQLQALFRASAEGSTRDQAGKPNQLFLLASEFCREMTGSVSAVHEITPGSVHYYVNGRLFVYDNFTEEDFEVATLEGGHTPKKVWNVLEEATFVGMDPGLEIPGSDQNFYASRIAAVVAALRRDAANNDRREEQKTRLPVSPGPLSFVVGATEKRVPRHRLTVVVDPVARASQQLVSLCNYISQLSIGAVCTVYLNPSLTVGNTIRNYYKFVGELQLRFDAEGRVVAPKAVFSHLPDKHLLTLGIEEAEYWTVFPMEAEYDLDNIILSRLPPSSKYLYATYRINSILISGSAEDDSTGGPSSGLPLQIRSSLYNHTSGSYTNTTRDTIVMTIKGYFQLQSTPGLWYLGVQPGAIARAFYISHHNDVPVLDVAIGSVGRHFNYTAGQSIPVVVSSFTGSFIRLGISRTAGFEEASIESIAAATVEASNAEWPPKGPRSERPKFPTLNIFTVASGHLYERFLRIMMHTVMRTSSDVHGANTTRIKFWLIENFLSPQFKELVPLLAEHYGFDVGFVTYRWPWWLNKQTEKQRTIWAYKILFLDVLFPLNVDRVIFVDADQIVQADLHELYNMNIGAAAMAYTPFCREYPNDATTNFRFWDQGFWLSHLRGKPYHISALYLVNVQRLRAALGGDKYRATYARLSEDPGSLANLDQDLPNFMQDEMPIFSLPEEWLWCETWCAGESKARAKTIDLCNNPLTKIPKLENVRRIVDGWDEMDRELEDLSKQLLEKRNAELRDGAEKKKGQGKLMDPMDSSGMM